MSLCSIKHLSFAYGKKLILEDLSFDLNRGEIIAFVGPSGCGKSTLLRCIAGLLIPQKGSIKIDDRHDSSPKKCSFMFQKSTLLPWLSVQENLSLPFKLQARSYVTKDLISALGEAHIDYLADNMPANLSGGETQRVSFVRALLEKRSIILLDEPFSNLDEINRRSLALLLSNTIFDLNLAGIFVTHSIHDAMFVCNRIFVLSSNPAKIIGEFDVPFPQPRSEALWMGQDLIQYISRARELLESGNLRI